MAKVVLSSDEVALLSAFFRDSKFGESLIDFAGNGYWFKISIGVLRKLFK